MKPLMPRLLGAVREFGDGCWEWSASTNGRGYGQIYYQGRNCKAHVLSYRIHRGPTRGAYVLHRCDNRRCINPAHLFLGSQLENLADMRAKDRHMRGERYPRAKLTDAAVLYMRRSGLPQKELAKKFGVHVSRVNRILRGQGWKHLN